MQQASQKMSAGQRGCIYAIAGQLGLVEKGNPDDDLHVLTFRLTGQRSLSTLSSAEADRLIDALNALMSKPAVSKPAPAPASSGRYEERPGGITAAQQRKVYRLMYLLQEASPSTATFGDRLCGIIRKNLKVDCTQEQPFRFVTLEGGWRLIETMKKLLANAEKKQRG